MVYWIRKFAALLGVTIFFILFFIGLATSGEYSLESISFSIVRAILGASLAWVVGIVIADILLKGGFTDIAGDRAAQLEGGLMQRIHSFQEATTPGGSAMPFSISTAKKKKQNAGVKT